MKLGSEHHTPSMASSAWCAWLGDSHLNFLGYDRTILHAKHSTEALEDDLCVGSDLLLQQVISSKSITLQKYVR